jgi:hypothetical protein
MKILDLFVDVKMDIFNAEHVHAFSLANRLALLGHKIILIIKGKETKVIRKHNLEIYISKFDFSKQKEAYFIRIFSSIAKSFRLLLLILSLRSWYISGFDISKEYEVFKITKEKMLWSMSDFNDTYNAYLKYNHEHAKKFDFSICSLKWKQLLDNCVIIY